MRRSTAPDNFRPACEARDRFPDTGVGPFGTGHSDVCVLRTAWRRSGRRSGTDGTAAGGRADAARRRRARRGLRGAAGRAHGRVYGSRVVLLVGSGDNGGDALYAGARLARRGAGVTAVLLAPERAHAAGLAALRGAGAGPWGPAVARR
ncbi:NAD(P)H-hydrate epimerase [Streptomyces sp. INA 01156]